MSTKSDVRKFREATLLEGPDPEQDCAVSQEWLDEIRRRCEQLESGEVELLDERMISR